MLEPRSSVGHHPFLGPDMPSVTFVFEDVLSKASPILEPYRHVDLDCHCSIVSLDRFRPIPGML